MRCDGQDAVTVWLCSCCEHHLLEGSNDANDYWPAMIYKFLVHKNSKHVKKIHFHNKWKLIPVTWRHWWEREFHDRELPTNTDAIFNDVTMELEEVNTAIDKLEWTSLARCMDRHFAYPEVRCPWGCSEFLHRTNRLKLKDFLWYYSNYEMKCYETPKGKHWTDSISPSYPTPSILLEKFLCSPCIAMVDDGPVILCCREHSESSTEMYLHVPESPTGNIYTPNANSFAPVAIRSRTNRNFKPKVCSDTFCTMKQVGGFSGIDSAYVTSANLPSPCDNLSNKRDALSIQGRPDIRSQIFDRSTDPDDPCFMPREKVERILSTSEQEFPDPSILPEYKSSSFITADVAVSLQEIMYGEGSRSIKIYADDTSDQYSHKVFVPPWPTEFVQVHPMDGHGARMQKVTNKDFGLWMLLCMSGRVRDVWEAIADSVTDNRSWNGHWLNFATHTLNFRGRKRKSKFFQRPGSIHDLFPQPLVDIFGDLSASRDLFGPCTKIHVVEGSLIESEEDLSGKTVVVCIHPDVRQQNQESHEQFELRCLLAAKNNDLGNLVERSQWRMYVRHKGQQFWYQQGTSHPCKYKGETLHKKAWKGARVAVYCRRENGDSRSLQRRYLNAIGGQSSVYCSTHKCPLILNHHRKQSNNGFQNGFQKCVCKMDESSNEICCSFGSYVCPGTNSCNTAICDKHLSAAKLKCIECGPESVLYLSTDGAELEDRIDNADGAIRTIFDPATTTISPEALGPTVAHELPQDRVDEDHDLLDDDSQTSYCTEISAGSAAQRSFDGNRESSLIKHARAIDMDHQQLWDDTDSDSAGSIVERAGSFDSTDLPPLFDRSRESTNVSAYDRSTWNNDMDDTENSPLDHFDTTGIPTTATGVEQREISIEHFDANGVKIPLSVFLNGQGHLLVRTSHKIRMNKLHRSLCERLVSKNSSKVVPLVYAEAQLFPTIFWYSLQDGTIPGAVPTALWADKATLRKYGLASMRQHAKMRVSNPALPTSVDPAYHFMLLDQLANLGTCGKHTRVVLQRGFADHQREDGVTFRDKGDSAEIYGETSENHANVHKLSALVRERKPHFFFTQTCNQKTCKGLRVLREWITSTEALLYLRKKYGLTLKEGKYYLRESAASFISRSWNEVADMWMRYIIYSKDEPLGPIDYAWYRKEFQDTEGNLAHIHAILRTLYDIDNPEEKKEILNKIRGCVSQLIFHEEFLKLREEGIISSADHLLDILSQAKSYLTHHCTTRCQIPQTTKDGQTVFVCKVKNNYFRSMTPLSHSIETINADHLPEARKIYTDLQMIDGDNILEPCLVQEYHVPVCSREDIQFSPTNPQLFARYPSSQNLQFTTGRALADYLVKYVTKMDDVARVEMKPPRHYDQTHARGIIEQLHNTKITSNKIIANKTRKPDTNYGRLVTHTECLSVILGEEIVKSTVDFVYFSTSPREYRQASFKQSHCKPEDVLDYVTYLVNISQEIRCSRHFPPARLFSANQMLVIHDERSSSLSVDAITVFSVRPPELRFVNIVPLFFRWFERHEMEVTHDTLEDELKHRLKRDVMKCHWIDGLHMQIRLRKGAIQEILEYSKQCDATLFGGSRQKNLIVNLFRQMQLLHQQFRRLMTNDGLDDHSIVPRRRPTQSAQRQYDFISETFLCENTLEALPVPWTTPVFPKNRGRFLIQILLLFGRFETEYELMNRDTMKAAYIHAGLFDPDDPSGSIKTLLKRYVRECLSAQCGSVHHHDRNLILANAAFSECLLGIQDDLVLGTPCVLQSAMKEETTKRIKEHRRKMLSAFIDALYSDLETSGFREHHLPNRIMVESIHSIDTPLLSGGIHRQNMGIVEYLFPPSYDEEGVQSAASYQEQKEVLEQAKSSIDRYVRGFSHKNIVICGGPGNGKTTVCEEICLYAFSKGLRGTATSIVADRSKALGGMHIHLLCAIPMSDRRNMSPGRAAESALGCIYRKAELLHFWRELQFLYIDEFGAVSAEMLATMDIIARKLKDSSRFLGGIMVICSMDIHQLLPIDGTALMLSMNMMCEFNFVELTESVRAAKDANLRRLCNLTRSPDWDAEKKAEFTRILRENCNFLDSFDDPALPEDGIYVFGRRAPCRKIEEILIRRMEEDDTVELVISKAEDEESSVAGNWKVASPPVTQELSRKLKRQSNLYLFEKGRYEFTYNLHGHFQQGQLAILLTIDQDDVDNHKKIEFFKGPPGCKEYPSLENFTSEFLESNGWERVLVPFESSKPKRLWGKIVGRRSQYGVRLRIASTIHASQGATLGKLITAVSNIPTMGDLNFNLWEAAQVVVLLSRTRRCSDIYFVGNPDEVIENLLAVLQMRSKYMAHITSMTQRLCSRAAETPILSGPPIFRPCDIVLDKTPAVYLLVSTRSYGYMYIGETKDIRKRLNDHNSGRGSLFTNNENLRPWALFGYVTGFRRTDNRRMFEQFWKRRLTMRANITPTEVLAVGRDIATFKNRTREKEHHLSVIQCGTYEIRQRETFRVLDDRN